MTLSERRLSVLLTRREAEPYNGQLALPGGYVWENEDEDLEDSARRVLKRKVGDMDPFLEQLFTFGGKVRDPRGWSISVAYYGLLPRDQLLSRQGAEMELLPVDALPALSFDHNRIVAKAVERLRNKASYSSLPLFLMEAEFTLAELQDVYEQVLVGRLDKQSFRRKVDDLGLVEPIPERFRLGAHRPAQLYRMARSKLVEFKRTI